MSETDVIYKSVQSKLGDRWDQAVRDDGKYLPTHYVHDNGSLRVSFYRIDSLLEDLLVSVLLTGLTAESESVNMEGLYKALDNAYQTGKYEKWTNQGTLTLTPKPAK